MIQAIEPEKLLEPKSYIRLDKHGVYRVGDTQVMLDAIVASYHRAESPDDVLRQYPSLTLEEIHGSIAFYLGHRLEVDAYVKRQREIGEQWRSILEKNPDPLIERLRAMSKSPTSEES